MIEVLKQALVSKDQELIKQGTLILSNLCQGAPPTVTDVIPVFCMVVKEVTDLEILRVAVWLVSFFSNSEENIARILESDIVPSLMRHLEYNEQHVFE